MVLIRRASITNYINLKGFHNSQHWWELRDALLFTSSHGVSCCWSCLAKFEIGQTFRSKQLPAFLLSSDHRGVAQQCWVRLRSSFNIAGATHVHYKWFPWTSFTRVTVLVGVARYLLHHPTTRNILGPTLLDVLATFWHQNNLVTYRYFHSRCGSPLLLNLHCRLDLSLALIRACPQFYWTRI